MQRLLFILLFHFQLSAQTFNGAPMHGMGNTGLAIESIYSITNNVAGLGNLDKTKVAIAYQPHFLTKELRTQAAYVGIPIQKVGAIGFGIRNYGIAQVSSFLTANLAYAKSFGGVFSSSISANYHRYYVENYISDNVYSLDLGGLVKFGELMNIGFVLRNATFSKFKDDTEQYLPIEAGIGFLYRFSKELEVSADGYFENMQGINLRAGLAYSIADVIILRCGASSNPMQYYGGLGTNWKNFRFDVSSSFHQRLGSSPQFALAYEF